jgi:uracil-DNA glycosylase
MSLTVLEAKPNSHANIWNDFINNIVKWISKNVKNVCIMLWGNFAQSVEIYFNNTENIVLKSGHPSPLNTKHPFVGCGHFEKCRKTHNIKWV